MGIALEYAADARRLAASADEVAREAVAWSKSGMEAAHRLARWTTHVEPEGRQSLWDRVAQLERERGAEDKVIEELRAEVRDLRQLAIKAQGAHSAWRSVGAVIGWALAAAAAAVAVFRDK